MRLIPRRPPRVPRDPLVGARNPYRMELRVGIRRMISILPHDDSCAEFRLGGGEATVMRRPDLCFRVRHLMIGVAVAAVGSFSLRTIWGRADEIIVRQYSEDWRPWKRGREFRVRLDLERLRAHDLSREDVMKALGESRMIDPSEPKRADPPPGVVFMTRYHRPDQYANIILKASPEGDIVRLKDVAKVGVGR